MRRAPARPACVLCAKLLPCCCPRIWPEHNHITMQRQVYKPFLQTSYCTLHTPHFTLRTSHSTLHLISHHVSSSNSSHLISASKFFSTVFISSQHWSTFSISHLLEVLLNSSQLFCTPESSYCQRKVSCTKLPLGTESFCTQKLKTQMHLQRKAFPEYFVLQNLHKALPSSTSCYKACTEYFPCTTLCYKAWTKHFPVRLCTTKFAQNTSK